MVAFGALAPAEPLRLGRAQGSVRVPTALPAELSPQPADLCAAWPAHVVVEGSSRLLLVGNAMINQHLRCW